MNESAGVFVGSAFSIPDVAVASKKSNWFFPSRFGIKWYKHIMLNTSY